MSKSTPINQLPMDIAEDLNDNDESINQVLEEIEQQNNENFAPQKTSINNNIPPIYNQNIPMSNFSQPSNTPPQYNQSYQQPQQPQMNQQPYQTKLSQKDIEALLLQNGGGSWSFSGMWEMFKSELRLVIAIFLVLVILQTDKLNGFVANNLSFINVPYIDVLMKAAVGTVLVMVIKKFIS